MYRKKCWMRVVVCAMLLVSLTVPAMAHGHHGRGSAAKTSYPVCTVDDCQKTTAHSHDGVTYCGHTRNDGHTHHESCTVNNCTRLGEHTHRSRGQHGCH